MTTGRPKDHTGTKFGRLVAVKRISRSESGTYTAYECKCDCGKIVVVRGSGLATGNTKSCGCLNIDKLRLLKKETISPGTRFGRLTAKQRYLKPKRGVLWECKCDCGKIIFVKTASLKNGNTKSCGCLNLEEIIKRNHDPKLILKRMMSANDCEVKKHWNTGQDLACKGGWEARVVDWLNNNKVNFMWQVPFRLSDGRTYIIDFYDKDRETYVEVKGRWRDDAYGKFQLFKIDNPELKVEVWDKEVLKQKNIAIRKKQDKHMPVSPHVQKNKEDVLGLTSKKLVYLVTGAPGAGKSWVLSNLPDTFQAIDSDNVSKTKLVDEIQSSDKTPVVALTIGISTFMNRNPQFDIRLLVIEEDEFVIEGRLLKRNGKITPTLAKRVKRMKSLAREAYAVGTSDQILDLFLKG